ncbi:MAG TPA: type IV secretion system protein VirB10 [Steroidobacteraceae bacterium]|nr:type IV secretion system protein VirB10 [Steroidobacteraceae bacterium]
MTAARVEEADAVRGERSTALVAAARSLQSRASSVFACTLMITLGVGGLSWYYAHALTRQTRARQAAQASATSRAQAEMPLPALGPVEPVLPAARTYGAPDAAPLSEVPESGSAEQAPEPASAPFVGPAQSGAPAHTPAQLARERRLSGLVFTRQTAVAAAVSDVGAQGVPAAASPPAQLQRAEPEHADALAALLHPPASTAAAARLLPDAHFLLPKGAFIDCTLETAIDSTLPGTTTCVTAADTFGADGSVVLLERGTKLVGETRGQVQQGQARVFVVWSEARTPAGVSVPLDSPGTDELGRAGLPGQVERHFWQRFGAAMLISLVDGAVQAGVQASSHGGGTVIYAPSTSQDVLTGVLKDNLQIQPTVVKRNGDRIEVLVAHDIDFRPVYELAATGR